MCQNIKIKMNIIFFGKLFNISLQPDCQFSMAAQILCAYIKVICANTCNAKSFEWSGESYFVLAQMLLLNGEKYKQFISNGFLVTIMILILWILSLDKGMWYKQNNKFVVFKPNRSHLFIVQCVYPHYTWTLRFPPPSLKS